MVEPLGGEHLVETSQRELPLLQDAGEPAGRETAEAPLEAQLVLLLGSELPPPQGTDHRAPAAPPLLGMAGRAGHTAPLVWRLTPAQLRTQRVGGGHKVGQMSTEDGLIWFSPIPD